MVEGPSATDRLIRSASPANRSGSSSVRPPIHWTNDVVPGQLHTKERNDMIAAQPGITLKNGIEPPAAARLKETTP
jgi:hypothetical protein